MSLETNLVVFKLRRSGAGLFLAAEPLQDGPQHFRMNGVQAQRFRFEHDVLKALERGGIGYWTEFPADNIQATVTREQLRTMGFKGIF